MFWWFPNPCVPRLVLQEAVSTGDPEMVQLVLQRRDYLKASTALGGVPELLAKIREVCFTQCSIKLHVLYVCCLNTLPITYAVIISLFLCTVSRLLYGNEMGVHQLE